MFAMFIAVLIVLLVWHILESAMTNEQLFQSIKKLVTDAVSQQVAGLATKEDVANMVTKDDLVDLSAAVKGLDERLDTTLYVRDLMRRIALLERLYGDVEKKN
jgi:hypothetical protein